jgi:putative addiction module component (TIGR02574 family)
MSATLEQIEAQALALPPKERSQLVDKLWQSLGDTTYPVLSEEWLAEIERRRHELLEGKAKRVPGEEVSRRAWDAVKSTRS